VFFRGLVGLLVVGDGGSDRDFARLLRGVSSELGVLVSGIE
jgi:hypothetical protein